MPEPSRLVLLALCCTACQQPSGTPAARPADTPVYNGIDVLAAGGFARLQGRRVGLITNHTGQDRRGTSTAELLHQAPAVQLVALFSPEHGITGTQEGKVADAVHQPTGLPVYSLYDQGRAPAVENLRGIDTLVFDIQDIGCRFYTYIATMGEAMQVASQVGLRFVVLDRPNPIGGTFGGPMRDPDQGSFVAWHDLPVRHGMTVGELARMFRAELRLACPLEVVPIQGWRRPMLFDETGQTFVNPSPNMRSPTEALLYPGVGLLETTNLSVGRGTDTPFELIGAPWMDGVALATRINRAAVPGLRCVPIRFTPKASKHAGEPCQGVRFWIVDRDRFDPILLGIELATSLRHLHRDAWQVDRYMRLLANRRVHEMVKNGSSTAQIMAEIQGQLRGFAERRRPFLLYGTQE